MHQTEKYSHIQEGSTFRACSDKTEGVPDSGKVKSIIVPYLILI